MKLSARNTLEGKVKEIKVGEVNAEVILELEGGQELVAVITKSSCENLGLVKGKAVNAIVKASSIIVAVD